MWITVRGTRSTLSARVRRTIEAFVRRSFHREQGPLFGSAIRIARTKLNEGKAGFICTVRLWSTRFGEITVRDAAVTIRTAVQQACLRARHAALLQLPKRRSRSRRSGRIRSSFRTLDVAANFPISI